MIHSNQQFLEVEIVNLTHSCFQNGSNGSWLIFAESYSVGQTYVLILKKQPSPGWPIGNLIAQICFWGTTLTLSVISSTVGGSDPRTDEDGWNGPLTAVICRAACGICVAVEWMDEFQVLKSCMGTSLIPSCCHMSGGAVWTSISSLLDWHRLSDSVRLSHLSALCLFTLLCGCSNTVMLVQVLQAEALCRKTLQLTRRATRISFSFFFFFLKGERRCQLINLSLWSDEGSWSPSRLNMLTGSWTCIIVWAFLSNVSIVSLCSCESRLPSKAAFSSAIR